ncbi:MAG: hypothetical protein GY826_25150 [Fuerstiella sp.]|jgi:hypothetical protein|nr:hypothetical protein [Fuerstiella sp.]MDG2128740.1 hypothetical protein [Fuerstiella sp.]
MWFEALTGFPEHNADLVRSNLHLDGNVMTSVVNDRKMVCGHLETAALAGLHSRVREVDIPQGPLKLSEVVGDVQQIHQAPENAGALFQVASQFNLLEMAAPSYTPEDGIDIYERDATQGPACAIACGAGTIYRNYFAEVNGQIGQTADHQIDCLADLSDALDNTSERLWTMQNGYALATAEGLRKITDRLQQASDSERDNLRKKLRIGVQSGTQVTLGSAEHQVSQAFCSALPVAYSSHSDGLWEEFATLVLEAAYEATICAAVLNSVRTDNNKVYLTLLGGGAFGNREDWILSAIQRVLREYRDADLDVMIVSYGSSSSRIQEMIQAW